MRGGRGARRCLGSPRHAEHNRNPSTRIAPFEDDCVMVVIETPKGSPNKLAFEPRYGTFVPTGVLPAGAVFPFDFGFRVAHAC